MSTPLPSSLTPIAAAEAASAIVPRTAAGHSVLFVDDDANVLAGLRRMLRPYRDAWQMEFVDGGLKALARLNETPFDVVVSDMRMPNMDGAEFFKAVMGRHPETIRIILSGQSDQQGILNAVRFTHQFLSKPCEPSTLVATINNAFALKHRLATPAVKRLTTHMQTLPSLPPVYRAILAEVQSADGSVDRVGEIISQDLAMSAKLLHLASSSFFGLSRSVAGPSQAATLLGFDIVKSLVLFSDVISQFSGPAAVGDALDRLTRHSLAVAANAKAIARLEDWDKQQLNDSFIAGLLHDVGEAVLMSNDPDLYAQLPDCDAGNDQDKLAAEAKLFGATHAEIGAYLMGLWGLPQAVVDGIAFHHEPGKSAVAGFGPLTIVHVADALAHEASASASRLDALAPTARIDMAYLKRLGVSDRLPEWRTACDASLSAGAGR